MSSLPEKAASPTSIVRPGYRVTGAIEALTSLEGIKEKEAFVVQLLQAEQLHREKRASKRRLSRAKFPVDKEWSDIDPTLNKEIEFDAVKRLGDGSFVKEKQNLCLMGQQRFDRSDDEPFSEQMDTGVWIEGIDMRSSRSIYPQCSHIHL